MVGARDPGSPQRCCLLSPAEGSPGPQPKVQRMPIDPDTAAVIARRAGLGLVDASALANLARDVEHAEKLASEFAAPPANPVEREQRRRDSLTEKSEWLARLHRAVDHNGHASPEDVQAAKYGTTPSPDPDPAETPPPPAAPDPATLLPGALPTPGAPLSLPEQIAAAEAAGDRDTAKQLKAQLLAQRFQEMNR